MTTLAFYLEAASIVLVSGGFICTLIITLDIFLRRPQPMEIMNLVWPLSGLWANFIGLSWYFFFGRASLRLSGGMSMEKEMKKPIKSPAKDMKMDMPAPGARAHLSWKKITVSTLHCGAGCTLADICGEWFTYLVPLKIAGSAIAGAWVLDYVLALAFGALFQYAAIRPMMRLSRSQTLVRAIRIDFFSLTSWQVGMYGFMAVVYFVFCREIALSKASWEFWWMMSLAMFCGFALSYPVNRLLIKKGIKKAM